MPVSSCMSLNISVTLPSAATRMLDRDRARVAAL
jgi:hypothetical protein